MPLRICRILISIALSALSALLATLAMPPYALAICGWLAPIPLFFWARNQSGLNWQQLLSRSLGLAFLSAFFLSLFAFGWLTNSLQLYLEHSTLMSGLTFILLTPFLQIKYFLLIPALCIIEKYFSASQLRLLRSLTIAFVAWAGDWILPTLFEWHWGHLVAYGGLEQWAEFGGSPLLTVFLFVLSYLLFDYGQQIISNIRTGKSTLATEMRTHWQSILISGILAGTLYTGGNFLKSYRADETHRSARLRVAIIQNNPPLERKTTDESARGIEWEINKQIKQTIPQFSQKLKESAQVDLILLGESAIPFYSADPRPLVANRGYYNPEMHHTLQNLARDNTAYVLAAEINFRAGRDARGKPAVLPLNASVLYSPAGNRISGYAKEILLPFGEYIPHIDLLDAVGILQLLPESMRQARYFSGTQFPLLKIQYPANLKHQTSTTITLAPTICYEIIQPNLIRTRQNQRPADILINLTTDAWFSKKEAEQHIHLARMRSIELRRSLVRASASGISQILNPLGDAIHMNSPEVAFQIKTDYAKASLVYARVPISKSGPTLYQSIGQAWIFLILLIISILAYRPLKKALRF